MKHVMDHGLTSMANSTFLRGASCCGYPVEQPRVHGSRQVNVLRRGREKLYRHGHRWAKLRRMEAVMSY